MALLWPAVVVGQNGVNDPAQWGQWRGPRATGVAPQADPPLEWSETKNIRWFAEIPGLGHASPIVWGPHVFVATAVPFGDEVPAPAEHDPGAHDNMAPTRAMKFVMLALRRVDGKIAWRKELASGRPHEGTHETGSWASNSPITDGEHIVVSFGSMGLFCTDMNGTVVWHKDLGDMFTRHGHGEGSSPVLHKDTVIVNWDHEGDSFICALDKRTGVERWRVPRDEMTSWATPLIVKVDGRAQAVVAATGKTRGYDVATGQSVWECGGLSRNVVASPVSAAGYVYFGNSYDWQALKAVHLQHARGDITDNSAAVAWSIDKHTPYVPSPLLYGDRLYFIKHLQQFVTCLEARAGRHLFGPKRLPEMGMIFASPVGAADRVYITSRNGTTIVLRNSNTFEILATNQLGDSFSASPAIVGKELYLRGEQRLYCIAQGE
jgi:outer membrane protein assembly factor BamB